MSKSAQDTILPTTFKEAFSVLQRHADTLRRQQEPNIDELVNLVTESLSAYRVCKERIQAVEQALERTLGEAELESGNPAAIGQPETPVSSSTAEEESEPQQPVVSARGSSETGAEFDDDIPF